MATLTTNLFRGQGERGHALEVVDGAWPEDLAGAVYVVGPDKREPGGHWFAEPGLIEKIHLVPDRRGRIVVEHRRIDTPVDRIRRRLPFLFRRVQFAEVSPFGITNLANTNVQPLADRLFVGYDAGRPIEVDPVTLRHITPVGSNGEWLQAVPGLFEPMCSVAAHPAADHDERSLYFVNYMPIAAADEAAETHLARWDLEGPVERWRVTGMSPFDSIHDAKASRDHIVFTDLPFVIEPELVRGAPRTRRVQGHTSLWIVAKADLARTRPGGEVRAVEVRLPMPTGHLTVDHDEVDGALRVVLQHVPLGDLLVSFTAEGIEHRGGTRVDPGYEGLVALGVQPSIVGRYLIDPASGEVLEAETARDESLVWGGVLATGDTARPGARAHQRQLWYAGIGFDPDLVPQAWWDLYGDATDGAVAPGDLPDAVVPGSLARFDLDAMEVAEVWSYPEGAFPSPPTFVPRAGSEDPDDGYVVVVVHQDGPKEVQVFDALAIGRGPVARATAPGFTPNLMLHSCWMPDRTGPRPSAYRVPWWRDVAGALAAMPRVLVSLVRAGRAMARAR